MTVRGKTMAKKESSFSLPLRLSREVDRLFAELIYRPWGYGRPTEAEWNPQLDLYETDTALILEADLPGVTEKEVSVEIEDNDLVLHGQRAFARGTAQDCFHCHERRAGRFVRRLRLPASVDQTQIRVEFGDGVLRVTLPKTRGERKTVR
jgi:HSP20 family protein